MSVFFSLLSIRAWILYAKHSIHMFKTKKVKMNIWVNTWTEYLCLSIVGTLLYDFFHLSTQNLGIMWNHSDNSKILFSY